MEMNRHPVWTEWQKASLYRMLADYYREAQPFEAGSYEERYREAVQRLAGLIRLYGNPFGESLPGLEPAAPLWPQEAAFSGMTGMAGGYSASTQATALPPGVYASPSDYPAYAAPAAAYPPDAMAASAWPAYASGAPSPWPGYGPSAHAPAWPPLHGVGLPGLAPSLPGDYGASAAQQPASPAPFGWNSAPSPAAKNGYPGWSAWMLPAVPGYAPPPTDGSAAPSTGAAAAHAPNAAPAASPAADPPSSAAGDGASADSGALAEFAGPGIRPPAPAADSAAASPRPSVETARLRLVHAVPGRQPLTLQAGEAAAHAGYLTASPYADVPAGPLRVRLAPASSPQPTSQPQQADDGEAFELRLEAGRAYTAAACPDPQGDGLRLIVFPDEKELREDCAKLRLLHLARTGPVDLMVQDGGTLFRKIAPGSASSYITLAPSEPELELTEAGSLRLLHAPTPLPLSGAKALTLLLAGEPPELTAFEDG
ncbi:DUF4397 domain-containing protein [Paenibacillus albicereus]|uniref:DUF4397 domain-containing protein n=1 Tax=Paenibacillus albicereus TaxID=2726185 RepID=A0A6H2GS03_9BACL|nr:DUF4397 domain-containing protein [Paenibacillus albicereus]QJC50194.1 DUF4397 domain-containing protein [Paenibacillus albicereus]